jgi:hypothetical protein
MTDIFSWQIGLKIREEESDEITIYDPRSGQVHELNKSAAFIFRLLTGTDSVYDIIEKYKIQYTLDFKKSKSDVISIIKLFYKLNLLTRK